MGRSPLGRRCCGASMCAESAAGQSSRSVTAPRRLRWRAMSRTTNILSVQSWVSFGHVGNAAAVFPLQRLGCEAWAINTVQFSNHTGYGAWRGRVFEAAHIEELVDGIAERGAL